MTCASIYFIPSIEIGLDQQLSMSKSSYVYKYFQVSAFFQLISKFRVSRKNCKIFIASHFAGNEWITFDGTACLFCFKHQITAKWNSKSEFAMWWTGLQSGFGSDKAIFGVDQFRCVCCFDIFFWNDEFLTRFVWFHLINKHRTRLNKAPSSWIDDYIDWLSLEETCCRIDPKTNGFCLSSGMISVNSRNEI